MMKRYLQYHLSLFYVFALACTQDRVFYSEGPCDQDIKDATTDTSGDAHTEERLIDNVDVFIGTGGVGFGVGSMIPGATSPFSMMKLSPDTAMSNGAVPFYHCAGYYYEDEYIIGFSHNHLPGVGVTDLGNILFMPVRKYSDEIINWTEYRAPLDHSLEKASPGYYSVFLKDRDILAELTVRQRSGIHRYTYNDPDKPNALVIDLDAAAGFMPVSEEELTIDRENNSFYGSARSIGEFAESYGGLKVYFYAIADRKIEDFRLYKNRKYFEGNSISGDDIKGLIKFEGSGVLNIRVGISYVDVEGAKNNLLKEIPDYNFDNYKKATEDEWEKVLSLIKIKTENRRDKRIFYTAMYHLFQIPTLFTDVDGRYRGFDNQIHKADNFTYYSDFSLWDTYRTFHPLISILLPDIQRDFNISLLTMYQQGGYLPRWPMGTGESGSMVGESANIVFADSLLRGVSGWDVNLAYEAMLKTADKPRGTDSYYGGREGIEDYINTHYLPADKYSGSVSKTLEYTYDDYAIAIIARYLNKSEDYERFIQRSRYYKNLFNDESRFFMGRNSDGTFISDFTPTSHSKDYVEGNAWQYRFSIPYDLEGLMNLFGGKENLFSAIDELFTKSKEEFKNEPVSLLMRKYYWHSNEPCILIPFIYCDLGDCNRTNEFIRWIFRVSYKDTPDGLPGNDDGGTMSAWYIMSALGLLTFPVRDYYMIGAPLFEESEINLSGKSLRIKTQNYSKDRFTIKRVIFNGEELKENKIPHKAFSSGGELIIVYE